MASNTKITGYRESRIAQMSDLRRTSWWTCENGGGANRDVVTPDFVAYPPRGARTQLRDGAIDDVVTGCLIAILPVGTRQPIFGVATEAPLEEPFPAKRPLGTIVRPGNDTIERHREPRDDSPMFTHLSRTTSARSMRQ